MQQLQGLRAIETRIQGGGLSGGKPLDFVNLHSSSPEITGAAISRQRTTLYVLSAHAVPRSIRVQARITIRRTHYPWEARWASCHASPGHCFLDRAEHGRFR